MNKRVGKSKKMDSKGEEKRSKQKQSSAGSGLDWLDTALINVDGRLTNISY